MAVVAKPVPAEERLGRRCRLQAGAEADAGLLSGVRDLVRVHLGGGRDLWDVRPGAADRGAARDLAVADRGVRSGARGAGDSAVRGPHRAHGLLLPMGVAAGQPEDRLGVRLADLLLAGHRHGGSGQRAGEPGVHAAVRHARGRGHRAPDHGCRAARSGRAGRGLGAHRRLPQLERGGGRSGDRRGAGDRADRRGRGHRPRLGREPHLAWCLRRRDELFRGRRRVDARDDHGSRHARRLRRRGEPRRGGQGSLSHCPARDRGIGGGRRGARAWCS